MPTNSLFISEKYYLKNALLGEYINFLNPLLHMLGIKLVQLATEKLYIHLNVVTENLLWPTRITPVHSIDTLILNFNLNVTPHIIPSGDVTSDPMVKAELLNKYFSSIFHSDNNINPSSPQPLPVSIDPVFITTKVKTLICKLYPKSAAR